MDCHIADNNPVGVGVLELALVHLQDGLILVLDSFQETRIWEVEGHWRSAQLIVRLCFRNLLHERRQVSAIALELSALVVKDVTAYVVQKARVVGDDHGCDVSQVCQVVLQPCYVHNVQVVRWLIL